MDKHVVRWAMVVIVVLLFIRVTERYVMTGPTPRLGVPSNVQDTITGDKKYIYM